MATVHVDSPTKSPPVAGAPLTILAVDDVRDNLVAIEAALSQLSGRIVLANSGIEALRYLLDHDVALILLDVRMPTMSGLETARLIRQRARSRHVPIIFLTAHGHNEQEVLEAYRLGAVDFLFKPLETEVLRAKVSVFVELERRTAEVARQARLIEQHEQAERERVLSDQRRRLEAEALRKRLREQRESAELLAAKNAELESIRAQLERSNERLDLADRRKDEFIAMLAHELRNPLATLLTGIELLGTNSSTDEARATLTVMQRQGEHLTRLVDDLLDVSRITSGRMRLQRETVRVADIIDSSIKLASPAIDNGGHALELANHCPDALVHGDPVRLVQVLANLLSNAGRYSPSASPIRVSARREAPHELCIAVEDDGQGMSEELLERVFDMFVQGETGSGGLGIGLTLARRLIEMHDGTLSAFSEGPGRGSRFEIRLAEVDEPAEADEPAGGPAPASPPASQRVVLVDDCVDGTTLTRALLEHWGHTVFIAERGLEGVELISAQRPDLAIVDIGLPDIDGYELARRVRAALGDACPRLIAMTGYSQRRDRERAIEAGFDTHLSKPTTADALRAAMHHDDDDAPPTSED